MSQAWIWPKYFALLSTAKPMSGMSTPVHHCPATYCWTLPSMNPQYVAGQWWTGVDIPDIGFAVDKSAKYFGQIQAWDINAGKRAWSHQFPDSMNWGGDRDHRRRARLRGRDE